MWRDDRNLLKKGLVGSEGHCIYVEHVVQKQKLLLSIFCHSLPLVSFLSVMQPSRPGNNHRHPNPSPHQLWVLLFVAPSKCEVNPPCLPPTRLHHNQIAGGGTYWALRGVRTSAAWLTPHLFSLMEGGGPLGERNHADASEWQAQHIVRDSPLALTLLYTRCLLVHGGIKENHK